MPIQPFQVNKYEQIPDNEDVTPIEKGKKTKRWLKRTIFFTCVIVLSLSYIGWKFWERNDKKPKMKILQSSKYEGNFVEKWVSVLPLECDISKDGCNEFDTLSVIEVNTQTTFQSIVGFGGAFTEASANNYFKLPVHIRQKFLDLYFGENGIGYNLGRIHINSCDFSLESYSFDDVENDYNLDHFDHEVQHDQKEIIPFIKAAMSRSNQTINLLASPWSPPAWMKKKDGIHRNRTMLGSADPHCLRDDSRVHHSWAQYLSYFISAYQQLGIPIWAITPQNEPEFAAPWEACVYNASYELNFINDHLGPVLREQHPNINILAFDHNKDHLEAWAQTILRGDQGPDGGYVDGMAFHWYTGNNDRLLDGAYGYDAVNRTHFVNKKKLLLATEGCSCPGILLNDWFRAERLGHDVMYDLLNYAQGWIDWNLLVDSLGGPNHVKNYCDAPILANVNFSDVVVQPKYYYMGHFSKYFTTGSRRVETKVKGNFHYRITDPRVRPGLEVSLYPCEKSTRQLWTIDHNMNLFMLSTATRYDDESQSIPTKLCLAKGMPQTSRDRNFLTLINCPSVFEDQSTVLHVMVSEMGQLVDIQSGKCVQVANDVREAGAMLELSTCSQPIDKKDSSTQRFSMDTATGELKWNQQDMCLTAGWPFLSAVAVSDNHAVSVVVMNEAEISSDVAVVDSVSKEYSIVSMPARSIQTLSMSH